VAIEELRARLKKLNDAITALIREFEKETGSKVMHVDSIPTIEKVNLFRGRVEL
jgi:hypothetical protein